ncbi:ATP-binding protein [Amycolatopsis sp. NPDC058986]|uniref:ATP-binding protein n=1 Tax=unclassified Amycolatopsis TaxID=2618356 RepID=UPI00366D2CF8
MVGTSEGQNLISGEVAGNAVQARDIGTVILEHPGRPSTVPRQLPAASPLFTGREAELAQLTSALEDKLGRGSTVVISALAGAGGIGKTWLALHWADQNAERFPDGQLFVDLRGFDPSDDPMPAHEAVRGFLDALGVSPDNIPAERSAQVGLYRSLVATRQMLIVLDNARDSDHIAPLLPGGSRCTVLVTSRDRMAGLISQHSALPVTVEALDEQQSHALLARRLDVARLAAEPGAVAELVRSCAGLPLALSIVAGRAILDPHVPLADLAAELRDTATRLQALDDGTPTTSLETVLSWSYRALTADQATVFTLLGAAPGPDISVLAAANLAGKRERQVRTILRSLERVSLLQQHAPERYQMHDLVRLYAARHADPDNTARGLHRLVTFACHTAHAADLCIAPSHVPIELDELVPGCRPRPFVDRDDAWAWLTTERVNLMATLQLAAKNDWYSAVWQLAWALTTLQLRQGHLHDNQAAWEAGLTASQHLPDVRLRTRAYRHSGRAAALLGQHDDALRHLRSGISWAHEHGDHLGEAHLHRALAVAWEQRGEYGQALEHAERAFHLYEQLGSSVSGAHALNEIGWYTAKLGDLDHARQHCTQALEQCRNRHDASGEATALLSLGYIAHQAGDTDHAINIYHQSLSLYRELGDAASEATTLDFLGDAFAARDTTAACEAWQQALELFQSQHRTKDADRAQQKIIAAGG